MKYSLIKPPPRSERYIICDVCGFKFHIREVSTVQDKYSRQHGLIVCKRCRDKTNAQDRPLKIKEKITGNTRKMRPQQDRVFAANENDDRVPGKPTNGRAIADPLNAYVALYWDAPTDQGSTNISGYIITRSEPQDTAYIIVEANTGTGIPYYLDETSVVGDYYTYKIAAINTFGTGAYSDVIYWPVRQDYATDTVYLQLQPGIDVLTTGAGDLFRITS